MHLVVIHLPLGPIPSQSQSQLYHHCAWSSVCHSVPPSVRPFVCFQLQSIQIQKTGKFLFTLSHDDAPHPHHNHLHHLFQNCPSVHIPQLSRKYFLSHFKSAPFQKRAALFSKVLPIYLSFSHHRQPHSSYTCAVWGPTQISKHPPQPHSIYTKNFKSLLHGDDGDHIFLSAILIFSVSKCQCPRDNNLLLVEMDQDLKDDEFSGSLINMLNCKINGTVHIFFLKKSYLSPRCPKLPHFFSSGHFW